MRDREKTEREKEAARSQINTDRMERAAPGPLLTELAKQFHSQGSIDKKQEHEK